MSWFPENICIVQRENQPKKCGSEDKESSSRSFRSWLHWSQRHPTWRDHTCESWLVKNGFWLKWSDLIFGFFSSPCGANEWPWLPGLASISLGGYGWLGPMNQSVAAGARKWGRMENRSWNHSSTKGLGKGKPKKITPDFRNGLRGGILAVPRTFRFFTS